MALATTTLASAVSATDNSIVVASATSFAPGRLAVVDQEVMQVAQSYVSGTTIPVLRGRDGTATVAHKITANVTHGLASDWALTAPQQVTGYPVVGRPVLVQSYTATGTLTLPPAGCDLRVILNGTTIITLTVPVPTKELDGCILTIVSNGVAAHVPTFTGGFGGAGAGYTALTFNATKPCAFQAIACNGTWQAMTQPAWTGTVTNLVAGIA